MAKFNNAEIRFRGRITAAVPSTSGNYATERITFGASAVGVGEQTISGITCLLESGGTASTTVELWVRRESGDDKAQSAMTDADYTLAGSDFASLSAAGLKSWTFAGGIVGAQIRVKSGGVAGPSNVSAWAT